jgi:cysteine synthase B
VAAGLVRRASVGKPNARLAVIGFFVGQSSGAYLAGAEHIAHRERHGRFVTLFNDFGERYFSTGLSD